MDSSNTHTAWLFRHSLLWNNVLRDAKPPHSFSHVKGIKPYWSSDCQWSGKLEQIIHKPYPYVQATCVPVWAMGGLILFQFVSGHEDYTSYNWKTGWLPVTEVTEEWMSTLQFCLFVLIKGASRIHEKLSSIHFFYYCCYISRLDPALCILFILVNLERTVYPKIVLLTFRMFISIAIHLGINKQFFKLIFCLPWLLSLLATPQLTTKQKLVH